MDANDGAIAVIGTIAVDVAALTAEGPSTDPTGALAIQTGSLDLIGPTLHAERPIVAWAHRVGVPEALTIALEEPDVEPRRVTSPTSLALTLEAAEPLQRQLANSML